MYCLLYKQVQSALNSYHNEHARLTQQKGRVKFTEDGAEKRSSWLLWSSNQLVKHIYG